MGNRVSVEGSVRRTAEPSTNGLKGQNLEHASPIQWPAIFALVHWTDDQESLLDAFIKGQSTRMLPMDLLHNGIETVT